MKSSKIISVLGLLCLSFTLFVSCASTNEKTTETPGPSAEEKVKKWSNPPAMQIDASKSYRAFFSTTQGDFTIELYAKDAPSTVNNFVFLAKQGYYDGVTFHRVVKSFMIQTGDPTGTGSGDPGYTFEDEVERGYSYDIGTVAMANRGPNTNGSQFFICSGENCAGLPQKYSIFGKVTEGLDVISKIENVPVEVGLNPTETSKPIEPVIIHSIKIEEK